MKKTLSLLSIIFLGTTLMAQVNGPFISFDKESHDYGKIQELNGKVTVRFDFINTGSQPLTIQEVKASCGCTAPDWTRKPVLPGEKGFVSATYDPSGRPGTFNKTVTVTTNSIENNVKTLRIYGEVTPKQQTINETYPRDMGEVRLKSNHFGFGTVYKDEAKTKTLEIVNIKDIPLKVTFTNVPQYISLKCVPEMLQPMQEGIIEGTYNGTKVDDWEFMIDRVGIVVNDKTDDEKKLTISANIVEDFSKWTPEMLKNAPYIKFDTTVFDFGNLAPDVKVEHVFTLKNLGKSDLIIHKIKPSCGCTVVRPESTLIPAGKSTSMTAQFHAYAEGEQNKFITIVTNDPKNTVIRIQIKAMVAGKK